MKIISSIITIAIFTALNPSQCIAAGVRNGRINTEMIVEHKARESRIVGGHEADTEKYPYFVEWKLGCGASLIYEDIVLTAAHCLYGEWNPKVWIGSHKSTDGLENLIVEANPHPKYDEFSQDYDFMILKLSEPVPSSITPIQLNTNPLNPSPGDDLTIMGFGDVATGSGKGSKTLQEVTVPFVPQDVCASQYGPGQITENVMFCAGEAGKDSCQGDSGGPIVDASGVQVGVVSWGYGCGLEGYPGVYSRVSYVKDWIDEQICVNSANPPSSCGNRIAVDIDFVFDDYPYETGWTLANSQGDIVASFLQETGSQVGLVSREFNLLPGPYTFEVQDSAGDGICCQYGGGGYYIGAGETSIHRDGVFDGVDRVSFIVKESGEISEISSAELPDTPPPTPTTPPVSNPDYDHLIQLKVIISEDDYPQETAWMLINQDTGEQMHLTQYDAVQQPRAVVSTRINVPPGSYWFLLLDRASDGLCCTYGSGKARIYKTVNGVDELLIDESGDFSERAEHFFYVSE